jgi:hypothetical protein
MADEVAIANQDDFDRLEIQARQFDHRRRSLYGHLVYPSRLSFTATRVG